MKFRHFWTPLQKYFWPTPGHKCRSRQIFGYVDLCPKSPKLARKFLRDFCQQLVSHKEPFLVWPLKKGFMCFSANVEHHFLKSNNAGRHFCPDFDQSKLLGVSFHPRLLHPCPWKSTFDPWLEKILPAPVFRGTCSSTELLKGTCQRKFGHPWCIRWKQNSEVPDHPLWTVWSSFQKKSNRTQV